MYELMPGLKSNKLLTSWLSTSSFWGTPLATAARNWSISTWREQRAQVVSRDIHIHAAASSTTVRAGPCRTLQVLQQFSAGAGRLATSVLYECPCLSCAVGTAEAKTQAMIQYSSVKSVSWRHDLVQGV